MSKRIEFNVYATNETKRIEFKVYATNETRRIAELNLRHVLEQLDSYIGVKIRLADGKRSAKFRNVSVLKDQPVGFEGRRAGVNHLWVDFLYNWVILKVSCGFVLPDGTYSYNDITLHIAHVDDQGILTKIEPFESFEGKLMRYDYNVVMEALRRKRELQELITEVNLQLGVFSNER